MQITSTNKKLLIASTFLVALLLAYNISLVHARTNEVELSLTAGSLTPTASGTAEWSFSGGVLSGKFEVESLPAQGSHLAYGAWFVNTDTGDKAFLGLLVHDESTILFQTSGDGQVSFSAAKFTTGPHAGSAITLASAGHNLFILLIENKVDFANPSPIGSSVSGTF